MIYFCADDYGLSKQNNNCIERCLDGSVLNRVSVLPNGILDDFKQRLAVGDGNISLHINLVEGRPLSAPEDIPLLTTQDGCFKHSFAGLFLLSLSWKRKAMEKQLYKEIQSQIRFWRQHMGENTPLRLDSHQHTHMIPLIFKTLLQVVKDESVQVQSLRIPAEPFAPYILTPSLYTSYSLKGLVKQWILKFLYLFNKSRLKKANIKWPYFMGIMYSGRLTEANIKKIMPRYLKLAEKKGKDIEIAMHPGCAERDQHFMDGNRAGFEKFYFSPWRRTEYETLMNFKF